MKKLMCIIFLLFGCSGNPVLYKGTIDYLGKPKECKFNTSDSFVASGISLEEVKEESENHFKRSALKHKANYIHVYEHYPMHINAKNPRNSGMHYRVEANIYVCKNS